MHTQNVIREMKCAKFFCIFIATYFLLMTKLLTVILIFVLSGCSVLASNSDSLENLLNPGNVFPVEDKIETLKHLKKTGISPEKTIEYAKSIIQYAELNADESKTALAYKNLGVIYYSKALEIKKRVNDIKNIAVIFVNRGLIELKMDQHKKAIDDFSNALKIYENLGNKHGMNISLTNLGILHLILNNSDTSFVFFQRALKLATEIDSKKLIHEAHLNLSNWYQAQGDAAKAFKHFKIKTAIKDKLFNIEESEKIKELDAKYQTEKKQNQIILQQTQLAENEMRLKRNKLISISLTVGVFLLALLGAAIFWNLKQKRKANILLAKKNKEILGQKNEIEINNSKLKNHQSRLETIVEQRTSDLLKAKDKAEESDRLKTAFLNAMSHELRTPLNAVIGFSDLMIFETEDELILEFAKSINISGKHLLGIIEDIFDLSMIESGDFNIQKGSFEITEFLDDFATTVKFEQEKEDKQNIEIRYTPPENCKNLRINSDSQRIKQIFTHLIKNSLRFTHQGFIEYGFSKEIYNNKPVLKFFVKDTGIGISNEKQKIIFDIFRQIDDTDTRKYEGIGIGLSVAKRITEFLGGSLWLESNRDKPTGNKKSDEYVSQFYFTIPFDTEDNKTIINDNAELKVKSEPEINNLKILIAEDDIHSFNYLKIIINNFAKEILHTKTGEGTVKCFQENLDIDLILMDINMPIMNGYDATRKIREINKDVVIIAQTAFALSGDREKAIEVGCNDYITKPLRKKVLFEMIGKYLNTIK